MATIEELEENGQLASPDDKKVVHCDPCKMASSARSQVADLTGYDYCEDDFAEAAKSSYDSDDESTSYHDDLVRALHIMEICRKAFAKLIGDAQVRKAMCTPDLIYTNEADQLCKRFVRQMDLKWINECRYGPGGEK